MVTSQEPCSRCGRIGHGCGWVHVGDWHGYRCSDTPMDATHWLIPNDDGPPAWWVDPGTGEGE